MDQFWCVRGIECGDLPTWLTFIVTAWAAWSVWRIANRDRQDRDAARLRQERFAARSLINYFGKAIVCLKLIIDFRGALDRGEVAEDPLQAWDRLLKAFMALDIPQISERHLLVDLDLVLVGVIQSSEESFKLAQSKYGPGGAMFAAGLGPQVEDVYTFAKWQFPHVLRIGNSLLETAHPGFPKPWDQHIE